MLCKSLFPKIKKTIPISKNNLQNRLHSLSRACLRVKGQFVGKMIDKYIDQDESITSFYFKCF